MRISDWSSDVCSSDLLIADGIAKRLHSLSRRHGTAPIERIRHKRVGEGYPVFAGCESVAHSSMNAKLDHATDFCAEQAQIGRASGRERGCAYGYISVVAVALQKEHEHKQTQYT